ncbi:hypothetical protein BJX63DRAFT_425977 [Aspergillus granulosus]|uniref:FAD/NAD(P)-binding domain-containing protein n=1 Tax=Aspergillus granulosus TaxID=176169 RepID=A0ABR4GU65_9EURO
MATALKNIIVVGGSYVGKATAQELAKIIPSTHRILLIEPHSHFHHLFAFPRFAIVPGQEHKAFIPYTNLFTSLLPSPTSTPTPHSVIQARVLSVHPHHILLDREWHNSTQIPFEYLVVATGTRLSEPAGMRDNEKASSVAYLREHQNDVKKAKSILIAGGGAVGVQMATDLKEYYPDKEITVVQSRPLLMPQYHEGLHNLIMERFSELGIKFITGSRIQVPPEGFPASTPFTVNLTNGTSLPGKYDFVILATGQTPNTDLLTSLPASPESGSLLNPSNGFINIRPTLQFQDAQYPHLFAVGDIADTGLRKAARPGAVQAGVVARNINALIRGGEAVEEFPRQPAGIHLTLGLKYNVVFRNPDVEAGQTEPTVIKRDDGREDMGVEGWWERMGVKINGPQQYHL